MNETIENLARLTGIFSASVLILSIFHEIGFFSVIGPEYRQLYTLYDYLVSAISWLPESVYLLFVASVFALITNKSTWNYIHQFPHDPLPDWSAP